MYLDIESAYQITSRVAGIALIVSSLQEISLRKHFEPGGLYDLSHIDAITRRTADGATALTSVFDRPRLHAAWPCVRLIAASALLLGPNTMAQMAILWTVVAVTSVAIQGRHRLGGEDGSDQLLTIMAISLSIALVFGFCPGVREAGLYFVGAQAVLAYGTAGIAKLLSPEWRHGIAVCGIVSTRNHGMRGVAHLIQRSRPLQLVLCWATILFEVAFLFAPILPAPPLVAILVVAAVFHASVAVIMGLNGFLWAFVSTYPAVIVLNDAVRAYV